MDLARSLLGNNLQHINEDGTVTPALMVKVQELMNLDMPSQLVNFSVTGEVEVDEYDLHDLAARCITQQAFEEEANDNGMAYAH